MTETGGTGCQTPQEVVLTTMTQTEMQDKIIERAVADGEFHARLLADPREAIRELTGTPLADDITIEVHEESAASFHLVLPPDGRLSETEMAALFAGNPGSNTTTNPGPSTPGYGEGPGGNWRG